ncbi:MAG: hypothetical protein IKR71_03485 [Bacteroidales bacterium]|nr:hypothetical protein [Bacteroidales bacterium]
MYSLTYHVTPSCCDKHGNLKLFTALQMMQDCSEYRIAAKLGDTLQPTVFHHNDSFIVALSIGNETSAIVEFSD